MTNQRPPWPADPEFQAMADHTRRVEQAQAAAHKAREPYQRELEQLVNKGSLTPRFKRLQREAEAAVRKAYADHGITVKPPKRFDTPTKVLADIPLQLDVKERTRQAYGQGDEAEDAEAILDQAVERAADLGMGDYKSAQWFKHNTSVPPERLRQAARRRTKRVRTKRIDGVVCYSVDDARRWWSSDMLEA